MIAALTNALGAIQYQFGGDGGYTSAATQLKASA